MKICAGNVCVYKDGKAIIRLSKPILNKQPSIDILRILIHEMIHLILILDQNDNTHGTNFLNYINLFSEKYKIKVPIKHNFRTIDRKYHWICTKCDFRISYLTKRRPPKKHLSNGDTCHGPCIRKLN